jgi:hypothetical protein
MFHFTAGLFQLKEKKIPFPQRKTEKKKAHPSRKAGRAVKVSCHFFTFKKQLKQKNDGTRRAWP